MPKIQNGDLMAARELGLVRYNTGKPCQRGHLSDRYSSNGTCIECSDFLRGQRALGFVFGQPTIAEPIKHAATPLAPAQPDSPPVAALVPVAQPTPPSQNVEQKVIAMTASAPREMTKIERRAIFSEIEVNYVDEHNGYDTGWNDARVAAKLKMPRAYIAEIRAENFGPEFQPIDFAALHKAFDETKALLETVANESYAVGSRYADLQKEAEGLKAKSNELHMQTMPLIQTLEALGLKIGGLEARRAA